MKLAELLMERAEIQKRISQINSRLRDCAKVQEGDAPPINPGTLLDEMESLHTQLEEVIKSINHANVTNDFAFGMTIADAITRRDMLRSRRDVYDALTKAAQINENRYSMKEIRFVSTVNIPEIISKTDELSKAVRMLDARIQAKNWEVEII
jgi:hypothetical protein